MEAFEEDPEDHEQEKDKGDRCTPGPHSVFEMRMLSDDLEDREGEKCIHTIEKGMEEITQERETAGDECTDPSNAGREQ
jgi:hypothetical protein